MAYFIHFEKIPPGASRPDKRELEIHGSAFAALYEVLYRLAKASPTILERIEFGMAVSVFFLSDDDKVLEQDVRKTFDQALRELEAGKEVPKVVDSNHLAEYLEDLSLIREKFEYFIPD